jgi:hypothetical protein
VRALLGRDSTSLSQLQEYDMYLSEVNTVTDAAAWLSKNSGESWTWRNVLEMFAKTGPESISVVINVGTAIRQSFPDAVDETVFRNPLVLQVCDVNNFLMDILMGDDLDTACAHPLALVIVPSYRFHTISPIRVSSLRLSKQQIYGLAERFTLDPFDKLSTELLEGRRPDLAALMRNRDCVTGSSNDSTASATNPIPADIQTSSAIAGNARQYKLKNRTSVLGAEIALAKRSATDPQDVNSVWHELTKLALEERGPFKGALGENGGLPYTTNGKDEIFLKKNLRDRMKSMNAKTG